MTIDPRDALWDTVFRTYYDSYYESILANKLLRRWQLVDEVTKVLVAVTASTSAVAGWALWSTPSFKLLWSVLAGLGALLAIVHASLAVPRRLKDWAETEGFFLSLRIELETLRVRMQLKSDFDLDQITSEFMVCRKRYAEGMEREPNDVLLTSGLENAAQEDLNVRLADEIDS